MDECGSNIALTPRYGWAPKGQRLSDCVPRNRGKNTTMIVTLGFEGTGECMILEGAVDALAFERYVEAILAPHLQADQLVIMDNLRCHKKSRSAS